MPSPPSHTSFQQTHTDQLTSNISLPGIGLWWYWLFSSSCFRFPWFSLTHWWEALLCFLPSLAIWGVGLGDFFEFSWNLWVWDTWISFAKAAGNRTGVKCLCQAPWIAGKCFLQELLNFKLENLHDIMLSDIMANLVHKHWRCFKISGLLSLTREEWQFSRHVMLWCICWCFWMNCIQHSSLVVLDHVCLWHSVLCTFSSVENGLRIEMWREEGLWEWWWGRQKYAFRKASCFTWNDLLCHFSGLW